MGKHLNIYLYFRKCTAQEQPEGKDAWARGSGEGRSDSEILCPLWCPTFPTQQCVHQPVSSANPVQWCLWRSYHTNTIWLNHWPLLARSNSCASSQWCHVTISSSVVPFSSCPQAFPESGSFPMSQFFASDGQSVGVSASASVLKRNIQDWFPLRWTGLISWSPRDFQESSPTPQSKSVNSSALSFLYSPTLTSMHGYWQNHSFH